MIEPFLRGKTYFTFGLRVKHTEDILYFEKYFETLYMLHISNYSI